MNPIGGGDDSGGSVTHKLIIHTSMFGPRSKDIYVCLKSHDKSVEYRARSRLDAQHFIEYALRRHFSDAPYQIIRDGDVSIDLQGY